MKQLTEDNKQESFKEKYFLKVGLETLFYFNNATYNQTIEFIEYLKQLAGDVCYTSSIGKDEYKPEEKFYEDMNEQFWKMKL